MQAPSRAKEQTTYMERRLLLWWPEREDEEEECEDLEELEEVFEVGVGVDSEALET